jgi:hypothetical protein
VHYRNSLVLPYSGSVAQVFTQITACHSKQSKHAAYTHIMTFAIRLSQLSNIVKVHSYKCLKCLVLFRSFGNTRLQMRIFHRYHNIRGVSKHTRCIPITGDPAKTHYSHTLHEFHNPSLNEPPRLYWIVVSPTSPRSETPTPPCRTARTKHNYPFSGFKLF